MARDYGIIRGRLWNGDTGRALRGDMQAQLVAAYLISCEMSNMIGLYYLPIPMMTHELGMPTEGASRALRKLSELGFAHYDEATETVWVVNMAAQQVGNKLKATDNQCAGIAKEWSKHRKCRFYMDFYAHYGSMFHLPAPGSLEGASEALDRPLEGPSEPLRRPLEGPSRQEQEQERDEKQKKEQEQEGEPPPPTSDSTELDRPGQLDPGWLAREFLHHKRGARTKADAAACVAETFAEMIRQGCCPELIRDEIRRDSRTKTEPVWELEKRLLPKRNGKAPLFSGLQQFHAAGDPNEEHPGGRK